MIFELVLIAGLGFLGSFGHCVSMCGPLAMAFAIAHPTESLASKSPALVQHLLFHLLLNGGRILSYTLVGFSLGALGSVLIAGGNLAGLGSDLRRGMALMTSVLLIWLGLRQVCPHWLPQLPFLNPMALRSLHESLAKLMQRWGQFPLIVGGLWGLIPCGFLYAAQIKAAGTGNSWLGAATMLAFGLGTVPSMVGIGLSTAWLSADQRSQLFHLGGWLTLAIGLLTVLRTGQTHTDYTGHAALIALMLALIARPINRLWPWPLRYRRALGVGAFGLSVAHTLHMIDHSTQWQLHKWLFMPQSLQWGLGLGGLALILLTPLALTSFDGAQRSLRHHWRKLHLLSLPALVGAACHAILVGSHYWGQWQRTGINTLCTLVLTLVVVGVLLVRSRWVWSCLMLEHLYVPPLPFPALGLSQARSSDRSRSVGGRNSAHRAE